MVVDLVVEPYIVFDYYDLSLRRERERERDRREQRDLSPRKDVLTATMVRALHLLLALLVLAGASSKHSKSGTKRRAVVLPERRSRKSQGTSRLQRSFLDIYDSIATELKKYGSSDFENILLKATSTGDTNRPKKKHVSSIITAVKEYTNDDVYGTHTYENLDFFALVLHKFHIKINHSNWRRRLKAVSVLHTLFRSLDTGSSAKHTSSVLRDKLKAITNTYCARTGCNYYCYKSILRLNFSDRDSDIQQKILVNKTPYRFLNSYTKYCLFRCSNFNADFTRTDDSDDSDIIYNEFLAKTKKMLVLMVDIRLDRDSCSDLAVYCLLQVSKDALQLFKELSSIICEESSGHSSVAEDFLAIYNAMRNELTCWLRATNKVLSRYDYTTLAENAFSLPNAIAESGLGSGEAPAASTAVGDDLYKMM